MLDSKHEILIRVLVSDSIMSRQLRAPVYLACRGSRFYLMVEVLLPFVFRLGDTYLISDKPRLAYTVATQGTRIRLALR